MLIRWISILLVFCVACQTGKIPCPEAKGAKLKKTRISKRLRLPERSTSSTAKEKTQPSQTVFNTDSRQLQSTTTKVITIKPVELRHYDVEDMDCPKPGMKKMPKAVKENIRKNTKRVNAHYKKRSEADSISSRMNPKMPIKR